MNWIKSRHIQGTPLLLPLVFFLISLVYLYAAPNFEASDTVQHVGVIKWIAEEGTLPVQSADHAHIFGQEASQPPLYYLMMAAIWQVMDTADFDERFLPSPFTIIGDPERLGNRNLILYKQPYPPDLRGSSLALYVIRLLSVVMGTVTAGAVYQSARAVMPGHIGFALLATAFTAFNPQFIFISASVSNDSLVNMLAALITWQMLLMLRDGFQLRRSLVLALLIALASLAKLSGLTVAAAVGLAALWLLIRTRDFRGFITLVAAALVFWLVIAGWWYLRNLMVYGELFGTATMLDNFGRRSTTVARLFAEEFQGLRVSYWGVFGAFNILTHELFYRVMDLLSLIGAVGLVVFMVKQRRSKYLMTALVFLVIPLGLGASMLVWWSLQTWASTGRLLFPYITSASLLLAMGIHALRIPPMLVGLPMLAFSLAVPFLYIIPNYDHPPAVDQLPASATSVDVQWEDIRLTGYEIPPQRSWVAGDEIPITLYWRSRDHSPLAYALALRLIDAQGREISGFETWPGWGTFPHPWMALDRDYRDDYIMQIPAEAGGSSELRLEIRWYVFPDGPALDAVLESGEEAEGFTLPLGNLAGN